MFMLKKSMYHHYVSFCILLITVLLVTVTQQHQHTNYSIFWKCKCDAFLQPISIINTTRRRINNYTYNNSNNDIHSKSCFGLGNTNYYYHHRHHDANWGMSFKFYSSTRQNMSIDNVSTTKSTNAPSGKKKESKKKVKRKITSNSSSSSSTASSPSSSSPTSKRNWASSTTSITGKWKEFFIMLQAYKSQHGHTRVPYNYTPNPQLGRWVARQRMLYRNIQEEQQNNITNQNTNNESNNTIDNRNNDSDEDTSQQSRPATATALTQERIEALQSIDFSFESPRTHTWAKRFDELCIYKAIHGDCLVPLKYDPCPGLGVWVRNQRTLYRNLQQKGKSPKSLSKENISALQSIGFVWDTQRNDLWKKRFDELMDFKAVYGHCLVPEHYHENPQLGIWVVNQRTSYKNFLAGLTGDNDDSSSNDATATATSDNTSSSQSLLSKRNGGKSLTKEKIVALESIGFCWAQTTYNWYSMFERLKRYKQEKQEQYRMERQEEEEEGNEEDGDAELNLPEFFQVPPEDVSNRDLRLWIAVQRKEYTNYLRNKASEEDDNKADDENDDKKYSSSQHTIKSAMTPRRIRSLESIGFPWNISKNLKSSKNANYSDGPTVDDWTKLFEQMREKGIDSNMRPKEHWFEGQSLFKDNNDIRNDFVKKDLNKEWTDEDLLALWNMGGDDD